MGYVLPVIDSFKAQNALKKADCVLLSRGGGLEGTVKGNHP